MSTAAFCAAKYLMLSSLDRWSVSCSPPRGGFGLPSALETSLATPTTLRANSSIDVVRDPRGWSGDADRRNHGPRVVVDGRRYAPQAVLELLVIDRIATPGHQRQLLTKTIGVDDGPLGLAAKGPPRPARSRPVRVIGEQDLAQTRAMTGLAQADHGPDPDGEGAFDLGHVQRHAAVHDGHVRRLAGLFDEPLQVGLRYLHRLQMSKDLVSEFEQPEAQAVPLGQRVLLDEPVVGEGAEKPVGRSLADTHRRGKLRASQA